MKFLANVLLSLVLSISFVAAAAAQSRTVFSYKHWELQVVALDDGTISCMARVRPNNGTTFAIWADGANVRLQYYADVWSFGSRGFYEDVVARVDGRPVWNLRNARFYKNSVIFTMPAGNDSARFLTEIARGNRLKLYRNGRQLGYWTLAGSARTMNRLIDCVNLL